MAYTYSKLAEIIVGSGGTSSINFTNIPQNYTDLRLVVSARATNSGNASDCYLKYNANSSGYSDRAITGNGAAASSFIDTGAQMYWFNIPGTTATANTFGNATLYIPNYSGNNNKSSSSDSVTENNATTAYSQLYAGLWANTAAINQITLTNSGGNFAQYSTAYLYGIRAGEY